MQLERIARIYVPLSAQGLRFDGEYTEIPPCPALAPYLRCFWGSLHARRMCSGSRVIPDSCMDLVFEVNYTKNRVTGRFCALDDAAYVTPERSSQDIISSFGIRFYAWTAACFAEADFRDALGRVFDPEAHFSSLFCALAPQLFEPDDLAARARLAEAELMRRLRPDRPGDALLNAIYGMISGCGREKVGGNCGQGGDRRAKAGAQAAGADRRGAEAAESADPPPAALPGGAGGALPGAGRSGEIRLRGPVPPAAGFPALPGRAARGASMEK